MSRLLLILAAIGCISSRSAAPAKSEPLPEPPRVAGSLIDIKREAEAGNRKSQKLYGDALRTSEHFAAAEHWYRAAAVQGDASALCALGDLYQRDRGSGTNLVRANPTNSVILNRLAALQGFAPAHYALFFAYRDGKSVERDVVQAYKHLLLSDANSTREELARQMVLQMSQQQISEAERLAKKTTPLGFIQAFEEMVFESIRVGGTMGTDTDRIAFINGGVVPVNGTLRIRVATLPAVIKCTAISKDSINVVFNGIERNIPFKRPNSTLVKTTPGLTAR
jgi:hypothetical protein